MTRRQLAEALRLAQSLPAGRCPYRPTLHGWLLRDYDIGAQVGRHYVVSELDIEAIREVLARQGVDWRLEPAQLAHAPLDRLEASAWAANEKLLSGNQRQDLIAHRRLDAGPLGLIPTFVSPAAN